MNDQVIYEISVLMTLAKCELEVTTDQLFDLITDIGPSMQDPISFVKTMNNLRETKAVGLRYNYDSLIHWRITELGKKRISGKE